MFLCAGLPIQPGTVLTDGIYMFDHCSGVPNAVDTSSHHYTDVRRDANFVNNIEVIRFNIYNVNCTH